MSRNEDVIERDYLARQLATVTAERDELIHAVQHALECDATVLCRDCDRMLRSALKHEHAAEFRDEGEGKP